MTNQPRSEQHLSPHTPPREERHAEDEEHTGSFAPTKQERVWATFTHLSGLLIYFGIPLANILGPLCLWLWKRPEMSFVDEQGREAVNFNISITLYILASATLYSLSMVPMLTFLSFLAVMLLFALGIAHVALVVYAALQANEGEHYRYPFTIPFLR